MNPTTFVITVFVILSIILLAFNYFRKDKGDKKKKKKAPTQDRNKILRNANRKLMQNPRDHEALLALGELFYQEGTFDKAYKNFSILIDLCATYPELDEFNINLKLALSALKLKSYDEAYKSLVIAKTIEPDHFQVNYNLGSLEYMRNNFEKAAILLSNAWQHKPDHVQTTRLLGHSLFKTKKFNEAISSLEKAIEYEPDDKESLFALGQCHYETGKLDKALIIFTHLRADPKLGPSASLIAGTINLQQKSFNKAIMDFEIGLKHENAPPAVSLELKYRLASCYIKLQKIDRGIGLLKEIKAVNPAYKDVEAQISKYQELDSNKNLQVFLIAPTSEFVTLCRRIAQSFFQKSRTKIIDISVIKNEYTDILTEVNTKKWEDVILFRFIRSSSTVGELILREMYARCKELRAGRGFCISAGNYSESAKLFVEARLIDLIEKDDLIKLFSRLGK